MTDRSSEFMERMTLFNAKRVSVVMEPWGNVLRVHRTVYTSLGMTFPLGHEDGMEKILARLKERGATVETYVIAM